eukprot:8638215-Pyramimonas_sp.AAC.1
MTSAGERAKDQRAASKTSCGNAVLRSNGSDPSCAAFITNSTKGLSSAHSKPAGERFANALTSMDAFP